MAVVPARSLPFTRLPFFAWKNILKEMSDWELILFSTVSKKTKAMVHTVCEKRKQVDMWLIMKDMHLFGLSAELTVGELRFLFLNETNFNGHFETPLSRPFKIPGPEPIFCVVEEDRCDFYGDVVGGLASILEAVCIVFATKWFSLTMKTNSETTEKMLTVLESYDLKPNSLVYIPVEEPNLETCNKVYQLGHFSSDLRMFATAPMERFPRGTVFENLVIHAPWMTYKHLSQLMNCKIIDIRGAYFSDENILKFIKTWNGRSSALENITFPLCPFRNNIKKTMSKILTWKNVTGQHNHCVYSKNGFNAEIIFYKTEFSMEVLN